MKILYFHQHFSTPSGASGTRSYEFAKALVNNGHQVTVVCGLLELAQLDKPTDGRKGMIRALVDGIEVIYLPLQYSNRDGLTQRAWVFLQFACHSIMIAIKQEYDLVFATSTPLTAGVPGVIAHWFREKPFVFEVRDLWPDLPKALGMRSPLILFGMKLLERQIYHSAKACIGLAPGIVEAIRNRSQAGKPVTMIPNGCDLELFKPGHGAELLLPGVCKHDFIAGYIGAMGTANGLDAVLNAAAELMKRGNNKIHFLMIGDGKERDRLIAAAKTRRLDNCHFLPPVSKLELASIINNINCGLMILKNVKEFYYGTSPNKFFDYISAGIPVLNNYPGWLADIIQENRCGVVVPPDSPAAFADALDHLSSNPVEYCLMGRNARKLAEDKFSRGLLASQFISFLENAYRNTLIRR